MVLLVTGSSGFIGSHIAEELLFRGEKVIGLDILPPPESIAKNRKFTFRKTDILSEHELCRIGGGVSSIYHFAANCSVTECTEKPEKALQNIQSTFNILEAARKNDVEHVIFASSSTVYGEVALLPIREEYLLKPISNYGLSKLICEQYLEYYARIYGIKGTALRYANIFGPRAMRGVMFDLYNKLRRDPTKLEILGNGKQSKSYLFITDAVRATLFAAEKQEKSFEAFNVGSEEMRSTDWIARVICKQLRVKPRFVHSGGDRGWVGDVRKMLLDVTKLKKLGWKPKVPLKEGIRSYIQYIQK